jgi:hypothetical protein
MAKCTLIVARHEGQWGSETGSGVVSGLGTSRTGGLLVSGNAVFCPASTDQSNVRGHIMVPVDSYHGP